MSDIKYEINGEILTLNEISKRYNIKYDTLRKRLEKGITIQEAVSKPTKTKYSINGEELSVKEISEKYGITIKTFRRRIKSGMTPEEAAKAKKIKHH